jgi:hypothetical protein
MKKRILNLGLSATHDLITNLGDANDRISISDFDAFVFEPNALHGTHSHNYIRRQIEIRDLVVGKGGIVICPLRQPGQLGYAVGGRTADSYGVLDVLVPAVLNHIRSALREGWGSTVEVVPNAKGASAGYFRVLKGVLRFAAYLDTIPANLEAVGATVIAVDSVSHPIGVEFAVGAGRICFVPVPDGATGDRVGSAIVRIVETHYGGPTEIDAPAWLAELTVPGATAHDAAILELDEKKTQIEAEVGHLRQKRSVLLNYRVLLYGYGKSMLEPVVRSAFRLFDFKVPEPDEYAGEWDVELHELLSSATAIGEVEGSEGIIDVDKYRQLLDYIQAESLEDRDHKGILIGNGYRLMPLDAAERKSQFSHHALRGAKKNKFCLLPTMELFKAVCAVLETPGDERLKVRIRDSLLSTVGVWTFAREVTASQEVAMATAASSPDGASKPDAAVKEEP